MGHPDTALEKGQHMADTDTTTPTIRGRRAWSSDGHPVEIVRSYFEGEIEFAVIRYLDGHVPYPVGGRVAGTEDEPLWEHRVLDGRVVRKGGDYYNEVDWTIERGLLFSDPAQPFIALALTQADVGALLGFFQAQRSAFIDSDLSAELTHVEQQILRLCECAHGLERVGGQMQVHVDASGGRFVRAYLDRYVVA